MMSKTTGFWDSPVIEELLTADTNLLTNTFVDYLTGTHYLVECRPSDNGRYRILTTSDPFKNNEQDRAVPLEGLNEYTVKSSVHEYGGAPAACLGDHLIFVDGYTKRVLLRRPQSTILETLRDEKSINYADFAIHPSLEYAVSIAELHGENHAVDTTLQVIDFKTGTTHVIASGNDFYTSPRFSPDGTKLCWVTWNHPSMPWSCSQLVLAEWNAETRAIVGNPQIIVSNPKEAVSRPHWGSDDSLYFVSDRSGYFLPHKFDLGSRQTIPMVDSQMKAEFSGPDWTLGNSSLVTLRDGRVVSSYTLDGQAVLAVLTDNKDPTVLLDGFSEINHLRASIAQGHDTIYFIGASTTTPSALYAFNVHTKSLSVIRKSTNVSLDPAFISEPEALCFPVPDTASPRVANLFYYPPKNPNYSVSEKPPLLVKCHGGPTSHYTASFALSTQYWTTRGFAVALVNYNGSSSFGRAYRENLDGNWGIMDTEDVCGAAKHLTQLGLVDGDRLCVDGGSSGGYLVLCCVTMFPDVFSMGTSLYGICDLVSLAELTHKFEAHYMEPLLGGTVSQIPEVYRDRSPLNLADRVKSPLLVLQGTEDKVVPPNQSELIVDAIKKRGGDVEYVLFDGEGHGFRKAPNIQKAYRTELHFYQTRFTQIAEKNAGKSISPLSASSSQPSEQNCLICHKHPIEYACVPCGHETFCKSCAMKQASGGKCRICREFFVNPRRIHH